jgi:hypothetical protein
MLHIESNRFDSSNEPIQLVLVILSMFKDGLWTGLLIMILW